MKKILSGLLVLIFVFVCSGVLFAQQTSEKGPKEVGKTVEKKPKVKKSISKKKKIKQCVSEKGPRLKGEVGEKESTGAKQVTQKGPGLP
jgi:hypothetical protein